MESSSATLGFDQSSQKEGSYWQLADIKTFTATVHSSRENIRQINKWNEREREKERQKETCIEVMTIWQKMKCHSKQIRKVKLLSIQLLIHQIKGKIQLRLTFTNSQTTLHFGHEPSGVDDG